MTDHEKMDMELDDRSVSILQGNYPYTKQNLKHCDTLPKTNMARANGPSQKESSLRTTNFQGRASFS